MMGEIDFEGGSLKGKSGQKARLIDINGSSSWRVVSGTSRQIIYRVPQVGNPNLPKESHRQGVNALKQEIIFKAKK
jgi:hypothetical protein